MRDQRLNEGAALENLMKTIFTSFVIVLMTLVGVVAYSKNEGQSSSHKDIYQEAYVYGFPMVMNYGIMYAYFVDRNSGQFKAPFNQLYNEARVFTPKDTAIVTPNSDTPYSFVGMDLRAEPLVFSVPKIEKSRYYVIQLIDMYTHNYGYLGSRSTGNDAGCYMVAGPNWKGQTPPGIKKVIHCETQFSLAGYRTQLFGPEDMPNVVKVQSGYKVQTLSQFLKQSPPKAAPGIDFPPFTKDGMKMQFPKFLNFVLKFCPPVEAEKALRARFATVGIEADKPFDLDKLSDADKAVEALKAGALDFLSKDKPKRFVPVVERALADAPYAIGAVGREVDLHLVQHAGPVVAALDVVLAAPQRAHRRGDACSARGLGHAAGLHHVVAGRDGTAAKAATGHLGVHLHVLGLQAQHLGGQPAVHKRILPGHPRQGDGAGEQAGIDEVGQAAGQRGAEQRRSTDRPPAAQQETRAAQHDAGDVEMLESQVHVTSRTRLCRARGNPAGGRPCGRRAPTLAAQHADFQGREPVDEALHVRPLVDGAVLRHQHVDLQPGDPLAPVALGPVGAHPALVEALGVADVAGEILDMPSEPQGSPMRCNPNLRAKAYPVREAGGIIWAYLGPQESMPALPDMEFMSLPPQNVHVSKCLMKCNYLQALEGSIDTAHLTFLHHSMAPMEKDVFAVGNLQEFGDADGAPRFFCEDTDFGMRISARRDGGNGNYYWRITQWLMPNYVLVPTAEGLVCRANLFIAIDDENCWWYRVRYHVGRPLGSDELAEYKTGNLDYARLIPGTYIPQGNRANDYLMDRDLQRRGSFTGIPSAQLQDLAVQESQGPIADRTKEHLGTSDTAIVKCRRRLLEVAKKFANDGTVPTAAKPRN